MIGMTARRLAHDLTRRTPLLRAIKETNNFEDSDESDRKT